MELDDQNFSAATKSFLLNSVSNASRTNALFLWGVNSLISVLLGFAASDSRSMLACYSNCDQTAEAALASFADVMATCAPSAVRRLAIATPIPREPPATRQPFFPVS